MDEINTKNVGEFLTALRKAKGMTQQEVADRLCVTNKAVSRWECGDGYPEITILPAIAELYDVTVDELLKGARIPSDNIAKQEKAQLNTDKQITHFIRKQSDFCLYSSLLAAAVALVGLILHLTVSASEYTGVGLGIAVAFFILAASVQIYADIRVNGKLRDSELLDDRPTEKQQVLQKLTVCSFHVYSFIIVCLITACCSIAFFVDWNILPIFTLPFALWLVARQIVFGILRKKNMIPMPVTKLFILLSVIMVIAPLGNFIGWVTLINFPPRVTTTFEYSADEWSSVEKIKSISSDDSFSGEYWGKDVICEIAVNGEIQETVYSFSDEQKAKIAYEYAVGYRGYTADESVRTISVKVPVYAEPSLLLNSPCYGITMVCAVALAVFDRKKAPPKKLTAEA